MSFQVWKPALKTSTAPPNVSKHIWLNISTITAAHTIARVTLVCIMAAQQDVNTPILWVTGAIFRVKVARQTAKEQLLF